MTKALVIKRGSFVLFIGLLLATAAACGSSDGPAATPEHPTTSGEAGDAMKSEISTDIPEGKGIAGLVEAADLGTDDIFMKVLIDEKQRPDRTAPAALRQLLKSVEIMRMSSEQGYIHDDGHPVLMWYFEEIGIAGSEEEVRAKITEVLTSANFAAAPKKERWDHVFTLAGGGLVHEVAFEGPHGWDGGRREAAGIKLLWTIKQEATAPEPTFAEVVAAIPQLREQHIDASVYQALSRHRVVHASLGGPWSRRYSLSLELTLSEEAKSVDELAAAVAAALTEAGFEAGDEDGRTMGFERKKTGSYAQVSRTDKSVRLHIQPLST